MNVFKNTVITKVEKVITVFSQKGRNEQMKNRMCYGLSFCISGQITYTHKGQKYISDPDHAVVLPKGESYQIHGDKDGIFPLINFECVGELCDKIVLIPIKDISLFLKDYDRMKTLSVHEKNSHKLMSLFYNIIHNLNNEKKLPGTALDTAIDYIEKNFTSLEITNSYLAGLCNISEVYFRRLFVKKYGVSPRQFIIDMRINKAKQMLIDGTLKINAISEKCGFSNQYHFCRIFRQKTGLTPTEYLVKSRIYKF